MDLVPAGNKGRGKDGEKTCVFKENPASSLFRGAPPPLFLAIGIPAADGLRAVNNPRLEAGRIFFFDLNGPDQINFYHFSAINPHILGLFSDLFDKHFKSSLKSSLSLFTLASEHTSFVYY
jgi:hypothetical protein